MKKSWKILLYLCVALFLSGCKKQEIRPPAVVTQVQIRCIHDGAQIDRCYTEEGQIRAVLDCLRLQRSKGTAQMDPERMLGDVFVISVYMSDGQTHIYRHRGGQYLSRDSHPWQNVDPEHVETLYNLLWKFL